MTRHIIHTEKSVFRDAEVRVLKQLRLLEAYQQLHEAWDRHDLPMPTFEQWSHCMARMNYVPLDQSNDAVSKLYLNAIESLVIQLGKCNLSLVRQLNKDESEEDESRKLAVSLVQELDMDARYAGRLEDLFDYYCEDSHTAIDWRRFGVLPAAQQSMRAVLDQVLDKMEEACAASLISRERAVGIAEGATAVMVQSGACQPEYAIDVLSRVKAMHPVQATTWWRAMTFFLPRGK